MIRHFYHTPSVEVLEIKSKTDILLGSDLSLLLSGSIPDAEIPTLEISDIDIIF